VLTFLREVGTQQVAIEGGHREEQRGREALQYTAHAGEIRPRLLQIRAGTESGMSGALPSVYAKNSLEVANTRSRSSAPRTSTP
jgi:hypothetical protein